MKGKVRFRAVSLLAICGLIFSFRAAAQGLGLALTDSPDPVLVGNVLTYTINLTNATGLPLNGVIVSNTLPASAVFLGANNSLGSYSTNGQDVIFQIVSFPGGTFAQMTITAQPTVAGTITDTAAAVALGITTTTTTSVDTTVVPAQADLGVTLAGLSASALVNDWVTYALAVTNQGPGDAPGVILTNLLPDGVTLIGVSPTNQSYTLANNNLVFALGAVTNGGSAGVQVTVQPTLAGLLTFSAVVGAPGLLDTNSANDTASGVINLETFLPGQLTAALVSTQSYDPQTGLMEQTARLTNGGTNAVPSARVVVLGLSNQLFNAVGTNSGSPFVVYGATLATNQSVDLLLEYFVPTRQPVANPVLAAVAVPAVDLSAPAGTPISITAVTNLVAGGVLIEFPAVPGSRYSVVYSDDVTFANARAAQPPIVAPADRVQWIDHGPPETLSRPTDTAARFYRVQLNQ
jgi:uncharacterized repeat protein (TIGR01451 family)